MFKRKQRGAVQYGVIAALAGAVWIASMAGIKLPAFLQPKPKTEQLSQTQTELAKARAAQAEAEARLAQIQAQRDATVAKQLDYAQQMNAGAVLALGRIAPGQVTPEVKLASELSQRAQAGLDAARGRLPPEAQKEIEQLVAQALSAKSAEVEAYKLTIAEKDKALSVSIQQKAALEAVIPSLKADAEVAKAKTGTFEAKADMLVKQVADYADQKAKESAEAGSWRAYFWLAVKIAVGLALLYFFVHFMLPLLSQSYPGSRVLSWLSNAARNVTTAHE